MTKSVFGDREPSSFNPGYREGVQSIQDMEVATILIPPDYNLTQLQFTYLARHG